MNKVKPAIAIETETKSERNSKNKSFVGNVTKYNVTLTVQQVKEQSPLLRELELSKKIKIIGGLYDLDTGKVTFYE